MTRKIGSRDEKALRMHFDLDVLFPSMREERYVLQPSATGRIKPCFSPAPQFGPLWLEAPPAGRCVICIKVADRPLT